MAGKDLRSGDAILQHEIVEERAAALGRMGRALEVALAALAACPRHAEADRARRARLVAEAGQALWMLVVQREACGFNDLRQVLRQYGVPNEVLYRMGPVPQSLRRRDG